MTGDDAAESLEIDRAASSAELEKRLRDLERENRVLRASQGFLASILESAPDFLGRISLDGKILFLNRLAPGFRMEDVVGKSSYDFTAPEHHGVMRACIESVARTGRPDSFASIAAGPNGEPTHYFTRVGPIFENDRVASLTLIATDISAIRKAEEQLRQAHKMEAVGQLAAGIAHNFNNMLAIIMTSLSVVLTRTRAEEKQLLTEAQEAATRAAKLVGQLLTLARAKSSPERSPTDVVEVTQRTIDMCRQIFDRRIEVHCTIADDIPHLAVDAAALEQSLLNLLFNARDALEGSTEPEPRIDVSVGVLHDGVHFRIQDNGHGMDDETRKHVFEPFFTTKKDGKGTGLGLATVYAMARDHSGSVECDSHPQRGTSFTIVLPIVRET
jgi:PAS domain S-box-containing protein